MLNKLHEYFGPGLPNGLREIISDSGSKLELLFYTSGRLDGLKRRVELLGKKMIEEFDEGSEGGLEYRSVTFDSSLSTSGQIYTLPSLIGEAVITKMTEKFRPQHTSASLKDIAKVTYHILPKNDSRIAVRNHFKTDRVTFASREFRKDG